MPSIPQSYLDLFQKPAIAHLATVMPDGSPQVTPVWVDYDGLHVVINTARGRVKARNMPLDAKVAIAITDPDNPYRYLQVRGRVALITEKDAVDHINQLSIRYTGRPFRSIANDEVRVIYKILPEKLDLH